MLPSIDDIFQGFGAMLVSSMDTRKLSRTQLAGELNLIGQRDAQEAAEALERQRAEAQHDVAHLERALKGAEELKDVNAYTIREWEKDARSVSDAAVEAIIAVLNAREPLDEDLANELRRRAALLNQALESGVPVAKGDQFSEFLEDLMDEYKISRPELAEGMKLVAPSAEHVAAHRSAVEKLSGLPGSPPQKHYSITLRKGASSSELHNIDLVPGQITAEHIHLIEAGALPSDDLYALLKKGLSAHQDLSADENRDLDRMFQDKKQQAEILMIDTSQPAAVIPAKPAVEIRGIAARNGHIAPKGNHTELARKPVDHTDELTRYAQTYMRLFTDSNLIPPPAEDGNERNKARTEYADHVLGIGLTGHNDELRTARRKLVRALSPLNMEDIPEDVLAQVSPIARDQLATFNEAAIDLRDHFFHIPQATQTASSLEALKEWLTDHGITTDQEIKRLNAGMTLESMISPSGLKDNIDIPKQVEHFAKAVFERYPQTAQESEGHIPPEFREFSTHANHLQSHYYHMYTRFNAILEDLQSSQAVGRYASS